MSSMESLQPYNPELCNDEWFKRESLRALETQLAIAQYPNYPPMQQRLQSRWLDSSPWNDVVIPNGPWWVNPEDYLSGPAGGSIRGVDEFDSRHRPLHPWFWAMAQNPDIGVVCGKGFYWNWGPNYTADPVVIRRDRNEPEVLVIRRSDTNHWALPGGFVDGGESCVAAAVRETAEETGINLTTLAPEVTVMYQGPVADTRTTAHAWAETTAVRFELPDVLASQYREQIWPGGDDALLAAWMPVSHLDEQLFGSHRLLIQQAL